jgi:hypothetical protein
MGVTNSTGSKPPVVGTTDEIGSFIPTEVHGVIITNRVYDKTDYEDIEQVVENAATIRRTLKFLKISNITELTDLTFADFKLFFGKLKVKYMEANKNSQTKILHIIYYAGHGEMYNGSAYT